MIIRRTTKSSIETVLSCDPAVVRANGGALVDDLRARLAAVDPADEAAQKAAQDALSEAEAERDRRLAHFRSTRDMSSIEVPADATRYTLRPLSVEERLRVGEAGLELALSARDAEGDAARALAIRSHRIEAQARIAIGLVKATDSSDGDEFTVKGAEIFDALPDALLYPAIVELDAAIRTLSAVDPVGKGR